MSVTVLRSLGAAAVAAALLLGAGPLEAQYFGQNKVQYETFDFRVLKTEHFDIYFYPEEAMAAQHTARVAERWYARLSRIFDHTLTGRQPLILYASQPHFQQTNAIFGELGEGTGGVTEALLRRIVLPVGGSLAELDHVVGHELVHAFQYDITGTTRTGAASGVPGAAYLPLWFIEGMAEYLSIGPVAPHTSMWIRGAIEADHLPSYDDLEDPRFFPYRYGHAFLAYVGGLRGDEVIGILLREASRRRNVGDAIASVLRLPPDTMVARWQEAVREAYAPTAAATRSADSAARRLIASRAEEQRYNLGPALSPDGSQMVFLSDRDLFSIDLFLADARTGEIKRRITRTSVDPHFQSLQFIESAGSWSPDGKRFVFAGLSGGRPVLVLYDVERGRTEREIAFEQLAEIFNPAWSPDGRSIAFSAITGGLTDLYIFDLETEELTQVTSDAFADLDPSWSPDGRTLAFATDRFTTNVETMEIGEPRLALLDLASRQIAAAPAFARGKQINPRWAPDGRSLYFLADPDGITNIYRMDVASRAPTRVTNLTVGISGITDLSPALSVAAQSGDIVFSAFRDNGYDLYALDAAGAATPVAASPLPEGATPAILPSQDRSGSMVLAELQDMRTGLPVDTVFAVVPYKPGLSLNYVSQPTLVAGADRFGSFVGGGVAFFFSDMLGNRNLAAAVSAAGSIKDISAQVSYVNLSRRWNWGAVAQQYVYAIGSYAQGFGDTPDGQPAFIEQTLIERQTSREVSGLVAYPFSRVQRVEFQAGFTNISFDTELRTRYFNLVDGSEIGEETIDLESPGAINLVRSTAALVYDNSFFGATGPILGQRYRFDVSPNVGTLTWYNLIGDVRKYVQPARPFTLAFRLLHVGRYGPDSEDDRLRPLFLGYSQLVRGYSFGSFEGRECDPPPDQPGACPVYDQLLGSRILVGNVELRFPLLGVLGVGSGYYGALPLDFIAFGDAGLAWTDAEKPKPFSSDGVREPVYSAGVGLRFNLFGFAILEFDRVRSFDRPDRPWHWQLSLQPGF